MNGQLTVVLCVSLALLSPGCASPEQYASQADAEVLPLLADYEESVLGEREALVVQPEPAPPTPPEPVDLVDPLDPEAGTQAEPSEDADAADALTEGGAPDGVQLLDLRGSLQTAFSTSREFQNQRESLYLQGLNLSLVRYNFGPVLDGTVALLWADGRSRWRARACRRAWACRRSCPRAERSA